MKIEIIIDTDNDAFQPSSTDEVTRIFCQLAARVATSRWVEEVGMKYRLIDHNGNAVGSFMRTE